MIHSKTHVNCLSTRKQFLYHFSFELGLVEKKGDLNKSQKSHPDASGMDSWQYPRHDMESNYSKNVTAHVGVQTLIPASHLKSALFQIF